MDIVNSIGLDGTFIGTVKAYNEQTREVAVYIPKLMPAIAEDQQDLTLMTNYGNTSLDLPYNSSVTLTSSIWVKPDDWDEPLPEPGSKVYVTFLEENPDLGMWSKFNWENSWTVIEKERYPKQFDIKIGDKTVSVNSLDNIEVELPEGYDVVLLEDNKNKKFKIIEKESIINKINNLNNNINNIIGHEQTSKIDANGNIEVTEASGLMKRVSELEKIVGDYEKKKVVTNQDGEENIETIASSGLVANFDDLQAKFLELIEKFNFRKLDTPIISMDGENIVWDAISGADHYEVYIDNELTSNDLQETSYLKPEKGIVTVKAISTTIGVESSEQSEPIVIEEE